MPIPVLLDMDPGVDDALAILLAMRCPEIRVEGITICGGNVGLLQCGLNALKTLRVLECDPMPPVALGAWRPLRRSPFPGGSVHGADGLGGIRSEYPDPDPALLDSRHAVDLIVGAARSHSDARDPSAADEDKLMLIATGPLTNVALAIGKDPEAMRRLDRIVWMGGAFAGPGNVSPVAEFNAYCDPDAVREVLSFGVPVTAVGLDATHQCPLERPHLRARLEAASGPVPRFAWAISQHYFQFHLDHEGFDACYLYDPLAVALAVWPNLATSVERHHVEIVCDPGPALGMTIIDRRLRNPWTNRLSRAAIDRIDAADALLLRGFGFLTTPPHVDVVLGVDATRFLDLFLERLAGRDILSPAGP